MQWWITMDDPGQPGSQKPNQSTKIKDKQEERIMDQQPGAQSASTNKSGSGFDITQLDTAPCFVYVYSE